MKSWLRLEGNQTRTGAPAAFVSWQTPEQLAKIIQYDMMQVSPPRPTHRRPPSHAPPACGSSPQASVFTVPHAMCLSAPFAPHASCTHRHYCSRIARVDAQADVPLPPENVIGLAWRDAIARLAAPNEPAITDADLLHAIQKHPCCKCAEYEALGSGFPGFGF